MLNLRIFAVLVALALGCCAVSAVPQASPQQPAIVRGELVSIDAVSKTVLIRTAEKRELAFQYTDRTEVTGAQDTTAGLASMKGAQLTIHFKREGDTNIATKIEVRSQLKLA